MSDVPQPGNFGFPFGFDLSQFQRMLASEGPLNWEVARQTARWVASVDPETGQPVPDPAAPPGRPVAFEDLARAAQTHVAEATGIAATHGLTVRVVDRTAWVDRTLDGLRPVLETLARRLAEPLGGPTAAQPDPQVLANPFLAFASDEALEGLMAALAPMLLGVQAGSMVGFCAQHALARYDLPLPVDDEPEVAFVAANVRRFAQEWSLDEESVAFALALRETIRGAQRTVGWVPARLVRLARDYVDAFEVDEASLGERLEGFDPADPSSIAGALGDPTALLGALAGPGQAPALEAVQRFASVLEGYTDTVVVDIGARLVPEFERVDEALRRHRIERGRAGAFVDRMLGLELDREHYERGRAFCAGVVERAGPAGLHRLWERETMVPTPAELEAPGLWLARIEIDDEATGDGPGPVS